MIDTGQPQGQMPAEQPAQGGGMTICIYVAQDGSITVAQEPGEAPQGGQPAGSIGEALKLALQMYSQTGAADEASQVEAGYKQAGGPMGNPMHKPGKPAMGSM